MSELLDRAAQIRTQNQQLDAETRGAIAAAQEAQKMERRLSEARVAEFIGLLISNNIPTLPLYVRQIASTQGPTKTGKAYDTLGYNHAADGWLARPYSQTHDDGITFGLFVDKKTGGLTECWEPTTEPPHDARNFPVGEYVLAAHNDDRNSPSLPATAAEQLLIPAPFGNDAGRDILAESLTRYGVTQ